MIQVAITFSRIGITDVHASRTVQKQIHECHILKCYLLQILRITMTIFTIHELILA